MSNPNCDYGPPFPPSAQHLIMSYHRAHSNSLRLAQYIGPGSQKLAPFLADYFQHINVCHTADTSSTREAMGKFHAANWWKGKFSFASNTTMEQSHLAVAKGSVDLCFLLAPEGWEEDVDGVVDAVAESLAPNGTMCVLGWGRMPRLVAVAGEEEGGGGDGGEEELRDAVSELFRAWQDAFELQQTREKYELYNSPLDFIPLRHEDGDTVWIQDVTKRIKINFGNNSTLDAFDGFVGPEDGTVRVAKSRVGSQQRKYYFDNQHDEGIGWRREVDIEWFRGLARHWRDEHGIDLTEKELRLVEKTIGSERIVLEWMASILLATRK